MFAPSLKVAFPYLYNFSLSLSYFKFSFAANQPTRNDERVERFPSVLFFSLFCAKTILCILYIARKKRQRRGIYKFSLGISLSL